MANRLLDLLGGVDRIRDRDHRGTQQPTGEGVARPHHVDARGRRDVGGVRVHDRLVQRRVELVAGRAEALQAEPAQHDVEAVGDRLEAALHLAVLSGPLDVVEDRDQLGDDPCRRLLDDLERALEAAEEHEEAKLEDGVRLVHRALADALQREGLTEIETDGAFDPHVHEALLAQPSEAEPGTVIEVLQKGYRLGDRVLRPARVVVAGPKEEPSGDQA